MTELKRRVDKLNEHIINGDTLTAMELFYADNVIMQENEEKPRIGKQECLDNEKRNLEKVKKVNSKLLNQAIDPEKNVVSSEWEIIFTTMTDEKFKLTEVSIQQWDDEGQVVKEKFYYKDMYPLKE